jgi:transcriptional regulator GlxA family with amidase domain
MSINTDIMPMRSIHFLIYPGFESLDISGPSAVFQMANQLSMQTASAVTKRKLVCYRMILVSSTGGLISANCGWQCASQALTQTRIGKNSTLLASGGEAHAVLRATQDLPLMDWLKRQSHRAERFGSICSGTFLLAAAGLLVNKHCTTHWEGRPMLAKMAADAYVEKDQLYVQHGALWTSAGGASGIDMALAMVAADHSRELANLIAKRLVVYAVRPGNQSQFAEITTTARTTSGFSPLLQWIDSNLHLNLSVDTLCTKAHMSARSFQRKFKHEIGQTPARFVETRRMQKAKLLLQTSLPIKSIAQQLGFASESGFRSAFAAFHQLPPGLQRRLHRG